MKATRNTVLKYSPYTPALTRALKSGGIRLHCSVDDDSMIYFCNGYFIVKVNRAEYDALIRPVTLREAGDWALDLNGEAVPEKPLDMKKLLSDAAREAVHDMTRAPFLVEPVKGGKASITTYYSASGDFVAGFNSDYDAILSRSLPRKGKNPSSAMVIYSGDDPTAMILPVRIHEEKSRIPAAVRAWFTETGSDGEQPKTDKAAEKLRRDYDALLKSAHDTEDENKNLHRQLEGLRQQYAEKHIESEALRRQVEELQTALASKPDPQPQEAADDAQPQDKAAALVEKLAALPGVTATVKGAQTAAPVVWLSGEIDAHADEIKQMGGKWSGKRGAWYFTI